MKPTNEWISEWKYGLQPEVEAKTSAELIELFLDFWGWSGLDMKSKTTRQRYSAALHSLGGYLVEKGGNGERGRESIEEFLLKYVDSGEGPLIHHNNESWQNELDMVCRKLHKYLASKR